MEFEGLELEIVRVELKYCERCGGLWLRVWGTDDIYCPECEDDVMDLPVRRKKQTLQLVRDDRDDLGSQGENWPICGEGGNA
jgi:hypothetical protein